MNTKWIRVINDISEDRLFGPAVTPEGYDAQQLQRQLKTKLTDLFPGVDIQVLDSETKTEVQVDGDDWQVIAQVKEVINQTWSTWEKQSWSTWEKQFGTESSKEQGV